MTDLLEAIALADRVGAQAIDRYGAEAQTRMLVEETGELLTAVARCARGRGARSDVVEECADVIIVALQVARLYSGSGGQEDLCLELERKAGRLLLRMGSEQHAAQNVVVEPGNPVKELFTGVTAALADELGKVVSNGMPPSGRHG